MQALALFVIGLFLLLMLNCRNQTRETTLSDSIKLPEVEQGSTPFVEIASRVMPTVVSISVERSPARLPEVEFKTPLDKFFRRNRLPAEDYQTDALGSGVIINEQGHILTSYHTIRNASNFRITLFDNTVFKGKQVKLVGGDEKTDLALLKVATTVRLPAARLGNSDSVRIGEWVIAVGNPFGLQNSVSVGIVSATGRTGLSFPDAPSYQDFIQTDAAVNPGSSGGPLVNMRGEVIGITTAIRSRTGGNIGINFAIPANTARRVSEQLLRKGKVVRGYLGISVQEITPDLKDALGLEAATGVLVTDVRPDGPAARAGIKPEDIILKYNNQPVGSLEHFRLAIASMPPGSKVVLTILREQQEITAELKLAAMPELQVTETEDTVAGSAWLGLTVTDLSWSDRIRTGLKQGVTVTAVAPGSPAAKAGILVGDVLVAINGQAIRNRRSFEQLARTLAGTQTPIRFELRRGRAQYTIVVTPD